MPERIVVVRHAPGYRTLVHRLTLAFEKRASNERRAWALVFLALAEFLVENGLNGLDRLYPFWLMESASKLTDPEGSKALPSNTWRRFAFVSLGMRALTIDGISRPEAARRAVRSVKGIGDAKTVLQRYDEFQKEDGVKNREAGFLFRNGTQLLPEMIERKGAAAVAQLYFDMANVRV
jgi:hypothetical protein